MYVGRCRNYLYLNFHSLGQLRDLKTGVRARKVTRRRKGGDGKKFRGEEKKSWMKFESELLSGRKKRDRKTKQNSVSCSQYQDLQKSCNVSGGWMYLPDLILEHIFKFLTYRVSFNFHPECSGHRLSAQKFGLFHPYGQSILYMHLCGMENLHKNGQG